MEGKKISFGFMKTKKAAQPVVEEKRDFIECVEEKSIKVIGGEEIKEIAPLVIPMKPNTLVTAERMKEIALKVESALEEPVTSETSLKKDDKPPTNETLDQMAIRELIQDSKKEVKVETAVLTVPLGTQPVIEGQKESTLEDYDSVPIQDFGLAMLRGMGWTPGNEKVKYKQPQLRPKGLGLGADKVVTDNQKKKTSKDKEEELPIVKNAFVKITTGKYSGYYGKIISLDEDNGRVMVDVPIKKDTISLSEFMMQAVSKSEYDKESKVINADSYDEYKKNERAQKSPKPNDREASSSRRYDEVKERKEKRQEYHQDSYEKETKDSSNGRNKERSRRNSSSSEDRSRRRKKEKKKYRNRDSSSPLSDHEKRRKHKTSRPHYSSESEDSDSYKKDRRRKSPTSEGKRDIDKKRKGKKKRRDRSRSPNHKKHRK